MTSYDNNHLKLVHKGTKRTLRVNTKRLLIFILLSITTQFENILSITLLYLGTGDIVLDMENQVKANNVRIELLEKQNDGLRNSITKLMNMQQQQEQQAPQQTQWATYVTVIRPNKKICVVQVTQPTQNFYHLP